MNKQITVPQYVYWERSEYTGEERFTLLPWDMRTWPAKEQSGRIFVKEIETVFEAPEDFDPVSKQIDALKAEKAQAMADFQARVTEIDRQIQSLLAIEHTEVSHG